MLESTRGIGLQKVLKTFLGFYRPDVDEIFTACGRGFSKATRTLFYTHVAQVLEKNGSFGNGRPGNGRSETRTGCVGKPLFPMSIVEGLVELLEGSETCKASVRASVRPSCRV